VFKKKFTRLKEDFSCEHCGMYVKGDGYTNHCPFCLWSKHVDVYPGDREEKCEGLMKPVFIETKNGTHTIVHRCVVCGYEKRNKVSKKDDFETILSISRECAR